MIEIPQYPAKKKEEDPVSRSLAKPDACAKPATMGKVRVRVTSGDKSLKFRRKRRKDRRDVRFF